MDINAEITAIKADIVELKAQLQGTTGEERIAIRNQIIVKEAQLTELYKHLPTSGKNSAVNS
jgi:hypothetical protein